MAFTVFRDDFSPRFVALFTLLLFLKCFHWLAEDRVDFVSWEWWMGMPLDWVWGNPNHLDGSLSALPQMERSPNISWLFHCRIVCK